MIDLPDPDRLLANTTTFLVQGQDFYEASILLLSKIDTALSEYNNFIDTIVLDIFIVADRAIYDIVIDKDNPHTKNIKRAFDVVLPSNFALENLYGRVEYTNLLGNERRFATGS